MENNEKIKELLEQNYNELCSLIANTEDNSLLLDFFNLKNKKNAIKQLHI